VLGSNDEVSGPVDLLSVATLSLANYFRGEIVDYSGDP
jgi:hypothetical protein